MKILGLNSFHADAAAALIIDGKLVEAIEEERLSRKKHHHGFPYLSIKHCLDNNNIEPKDINVVAISTNPNSNLKQKILFTIKNPSIKRVLGFLKRRKNKFNIKKILIEMGFPDNIEVAYFEHHLCHIQSAYAGISTKSAALTVDGFGDFLSCKGGFIDQEMQFNELFEVPYPHSLGIFYQSMTQFLGFKHYGDEYKIMGLAPYGEPKYFNDILKIINLHKKGFSLNLSYFQHHLVDIEDIEDNIPTFKDLFSEKLTESFPDIVRDGRGQDKSSKDFAASVQKVYEHAFLHLLNLLKVADPDIQNLVVAGGCGNNSVANGKIKPLGIYNNIYVPASSGDAGCAIGAAVLASENKSLVRDSFFSPYLANTLKESDIPSIIQDAETNKFFIYKDFPNKEPEEILAELIYSGLICGRCSGEMEWGPRALGNRSILASPTDLNIREKINAKIKFRELFRPFAPSFLEEEVVNWLEVDDVVPYMMKVYNVKEEKRNIISAVTHVDGSARLQSVSKKSNSKYYNLIKHFQKLSGVPTVLNTSLNENEPIVSSYHEAYSVFKRTDMDAIQLGEVIISRKEHQI